MEEELEKTLQEILHNFKKKTLHETIDLYRM